MSDTRARPAAAAGTWKLGDLTVNRLGFGAMRLTGGTPSHRAAGRVTASGPSPCCGAPSSSA